MLNTEEKYLIEFVQDHAEMQSLRTRAKLYRGLADLIEEQEKETRDSLYKRASILEKTEARCEELNLKFHTR